MSAIIETRKNEQGKIVYMKMCDGYEVNYAYDDKGNCLSRTDSDGNAEYYTYDKKGNIVDFYKVRGRVGV